MPTGASGHVLAVAAAAKLRFLTAIGDKQAMAILRGQPLVRKRLRISEMPRAAVLSMGPPALHQVSRNPTASMTAFGACQSCPPGGLDGFLSSAMDTEREAARAETYETMTRREFGGQEWPVEGPYTYDCWLEALDR